MKRKKSIDREFDPPINISHRKLQAGQMLLEVVLALGVVVIVMGAIANIVVSSLSSAQYTRNQGLANSYAQEGLNVLRRIRDSSWSDFCSYAATNYCLPQNNVLASYDSSNCSVNGAIGIFVRKVDLSHNSPNCCPGNNTTCSSGTCLLGVRGSSATVTVSWTDGKCPSGTPYCNKVKLATCFLNIDLIPAP